MKAESLNEILARDAAEQSKRLTLPKTPDEYKVEPTTNFKPPDGIEFTLNQADPLVANFKALAHKYGLPQSGVNEMVDIYGALVVARDLSFKAGHEAEIAKLGTTGPQRVDAIQIWAKAKGYEHIGKVLFTEGAVKDMEKIMADMRSQGASSYTGNGRDNGAGDGKIPGYDNMTFAQKRHAQEQRRNGAR